MGKKIKLKPTKGKRNAQVSEPGQSGQLKIGTAIELEHSKSLGKFLKPGVRIIEVAKAIASDHLREDKNYYKNREKIETGLSDKTTLVVNKAQSPYLENGKTRFNIRNKPGVYLIYKSRSLVYVGFSASDVYKALYRHLQEWNDPNQQRITYKNLKNITVRVVYTKTGTKARQLEEALILKHKPPHNINRYDGFIMDEKNKEALNEFNAAPKDEIYQYAGDLPF